MARAGGAGAATWIGLLRGVNVGRSGQLPMTAFVAALQESGAARVRTYLRSGNAVFEASPTVASRLPARVEAAIEARHGFRPPLLLRTAAQWAAIAAANPFLRAGAEPDRLHVLLLREVPDARRAAALDPGRSPPDAFEVRGREIYLHLPNGVARSKLTNVWFESKLGTPCTGRNWRTVLALLELARARS